MRIDIPRAASLALCALVTQLAACGGGGSSPDLQRTTRAGAVLGTDNTASSATYAWLGVPYAKPPVGALRWMPPVDPEAWTGVRPAQQFGASCVQGGRFFSPAPNNAPYSLAVREGFGKPVGSEDCLTLNIWRPANDEAKRPVIVFIHGGSNISGYTADPVYNGETLARKANAVVVTLNYRLGLFGWLDLPQLKTGDARADSGNFATLDQVQALKFINQNIEAFGGDPGNVTVMGQSAGAVNVWAMVLTPGAEGLMHKAVSMSGGISTAPPATAQTYARGLLQAMVIADGKATDAATAQAFLATQSAAQVAAYVRGKSADDIIKVSLANPALGNAPAVIADGTVIPASPAAAIAAGNYRRVPMLAGNTQEEGKLFGGLVGAYKPNDFDRFTLQYNFNPDAAPTLTEADLLNPAVLPVDKPTSGWNAVAAGLSNAVFITPGTASMNALAAKQPSQTWYYRFDWNQEPAPFNTVYGSVHAMDVPFVFGNFGRNIFSFAYSTANKPGREALSDAMIGTVAAFARTGNPNNAALGTSWPNWPATMVFDASLTQTRIRAN